MNFQNKLGFISFVLAMLILMLSASSLVYSEDDVHPFTESINYYSYDVDENPSDVAIETTTPSTISPPSTPAIPTKGYYIHINLDFKQMYVYKHGELYKTYPVSGGKSSTPSPLGNWKIISKDTWGEGFGGTWMGFNVPYGKYGIHGTIYPWFVGNTNASKGCIRMKNADAKELSKFIPHGTTVAITYINIPFRTIHSGDFGPDVKNLQLNLKKLGFYNYSINGRFDTSLKNSLIKFQKKHKLIATGELNRRTYNLIISKIKELDEPIKTTPLS